MKYKQLLDDYFIYIYNDNKIHKAIFVYEVDIIKTALHFMKEQRTKRI